MVDHVLYDIHKIHSIEKTQLYEKLIKNIFKQTNDHIIIIIILFLKN